MFDRPPVGEPRVARTVTMALLASLALVGCSRARPTPPPADRVRVMSFNLWHGGEAGGQPLAATLQVIEAARADIVGLQETHGREREGVRPDASVALAEALGWHRQAQPGRTAILSRWPILRRLGDAGAVVRLPSGRALHVLNVHLAHAPYQPYQLLRIPYEDAPFLTTADALVDAARDARGAEIETVLAEVRPLVATGEAIVLTGDFNEPSHLDWTARAVEAGLAPLAVAYPTSRAVERAGLRDAFRVRHPDEAARPGWTWTPTTRPDDPTDRHDRIDFVYSAGVDVADVAVVGEDEAVGDLVVRPWPSDHRAVVATVDVASPR